jgi:CheY-like chemotaxis protein
MPGLDGIDVVAELARRGPDVPVVLLSAHSDAALIRAASTPAPPHTSPSCEPRGDPRGVSGAAHVEG